MNTLELELSDSTLQYYLHCLPSDCSLIPFLEQLLHMIADKRVRNE